MNERRGFFDECHSGEIDPGYFWLMQGTKKVGEVWAEAHKINAIFYGIYETPRAQKPDIDTKFLRKDKLGGSNDPTLNYQLQNLQGPFTHVTYSGVFVQFYP